MTEEVSFGVGHNQLIPIDSGAIRFKIKGNGCVFWLVAKEPYSTLYEIYLQNPDSSITCCKTDNTMYYSTNIFLNNNSFQALWLSWYNGKICIGCVEQAPFIEFPCFERDDHYQIRYIQFHKPGNVENHGDWKVEVPPCTILRMQPKKIEGGKLHWVRIIDDKLPPDALIGGFENEPTYIARAYHNNSLCPGRYIPSKRIALIPWGHAAHNKQQEDIEILCGYDAVWVNTSSNNIPENAFKAGTSEVNNEPLYIGRAMHDGNLLTGKVHALYSTCYLPYKGQEVSVGSFELLVLPYVRVRGI